jgi:hypothetical protein
VGRSDEREHDRVGGSGLLFLPPPLMILFRQKYPRWWFDWNLQLLRFSNRVGVYLALMDDRYPVPHLAGDRTVSRWRSGHVDGAGLRGRPGTWGKARLRSP